MPRDEKPVDDLATETDDPLLKEPVDRHDHTEGLRSAAVALVEYGDYQSAACGQAHAFVKRLQERMGDRLSFTFRRFVVTGVHPYAQRAAEAAEAAGGQGRFWEMHDALFAHQEELDDGHLVEYADELGLDTSQFLRDMVGHHYAERVREGLQAALRCGVSRAPTFFVNGVLFTEEWSQEALSEAVERATRGPH